MPTFTSPVHGAWRFGDPNDPSTDRFWAHYGAQNQGRTLLRSGGVWSIVNTPSTGQIREADRIVDVHGKKVPGVLTGGHETPVTETVAAELTAAGFGAYLT